MTKKKRRKDSIQGRGATAQTRGEKSNQINRVKRESGNHPEEKQVPGVNGEE